MNKTIKVLNLFLSLMLVMNNIYCLNLLMNKGNTIVDLLKENQTNDLTFSTIISKINDKDESDFYTSAKLAFVLLRLYDQANKVLLLCYEDDEISSEDLKKNYEMKEKDIYRNLNNLKEIIKSRNTKLYNEIYNEKGFDVKLSTFTEYKSNKTVIYKFLSSKLIKLLNNLKGPSFLKNIQNFFSSEQKYSDETNISPLKKSSPSKDSTSFGKCVESNLSFEIDLSKPKVKKDVKKEVPSVFTNLTYAFGDELTAGLFCVFHYIYVFFHNAYTADRNRMKYCHENA